MTLRDNNNLGSVFWLENYQSSLLLKGKAFVHTTFANWTLIVKAYVQYQQEEVIKCDGNENKFCFQRSQVRLANDNALFITKVLSNTKDIAATIEKLALRVENKNKFCIGWIPSCDCVHAVTSQKTCTFSVTTNIEPQPKSITSTNSWINI